LTASELLGDTPTPHPLGAPERVALHAFAIAKGPTLDHGDGWECRHGPECPNRTRVGALHATIEEALAGAPRFALRAAQLTMSREADDLSTEVLRFVDRLEPIHIVCLDGFLDACFDYRARGCHIADAYEQLCHGEGSGRAWDTVRQHREEFGAQAALLPGTSREGELFAFTSACRELSMTSVETIAVDSASI
jgi:hypothetical protein